LLLTSLVLCAISGCRPSESHVVLPPPIPQNSPANTASPRSEVAPRSDVAPPTAPASAAEPIVYVAAPPQPDPSAEFFNQGKIPNLRIRLTPKEEAQLRADQRRYVDCTLTEDDTRTYEKVRVKLKGAAGSFRNLDDRPAFTLSMKKKGERFHGLDKFHLNNSVQDESYLNELICAQLFLEAGYPAARVTHARVWLNDRDLGFYVLKEGFDEHFIARHFSGPQGNLYDGGFCQDIDAQLEKDAGDGPDDLSDLKALVAACREGNQEQRWALVEAKLDVPAFLNYVALELMMSHWDGYARNRNNYRVYFRGDNHKAMFLPHGMDQMFGDANAGVFDVPGAMVCSAVLHNPKWKDQYRERVRALLPLFSADKLHAKIDTAHARMRPVVAKISEDRARHLDDRVRDFKNRVAERQKNIRNQFPPEPIPFNAQGVALIEDWEPRAADGDVKLEKKMIGGRLHLSIETGPSNRCASSFRTKVRLARGRYRLEAKVSTNNVTPLADSSGAGAGVRLSGQMRTTGASGSAGGQTVAHEFEIGEELREVELVAELRSTSGSALFDAATLRVVKIP
jgi:hypothetical protein